ncbi:hypothetical protein CBR_g30567 [Chara braunii]|uniref:DNA polymerase eta n=1 Tax=Chara braunii TaxID=69332 RepID=A0A388LD11_CHABU|nr:hypothetical protein CBR_g30567 [Chara braunii]|eukprot:GBG80201.1 hypothetical protein CBR_g30567 [Chara braunii]
MASASPSALSSSWPSSWTASPWAQRTISGGSTWPRRDGHANNTPLRVVAHVDMDCFYVQVEQRKQPLLRGRPTAVKQYNPWLGGALIAVSYEARRYGVTRHMRGDEAKQKCPELQLIQVPTAHGKADLTDYRNAGAEVVAILSRAGPCERASIDEAYIDLTDTVRARLSSNLDDFPLEAQKTHIVGQPEGGEENAAALWLCNAEEIGDRMLACAAVIIAELRQVILTETQFTCSAGIAHNKMLAKLASGMHKPAQQTLVPSSGVLPLLKSLPLKDVKQLGGKLGRSIEADLGVQTAGDLWCFSEQRLQEMYGANTGSWLWQAVRGLYDEPVQERVLPKSLSCGKTFRGRNTLTEMEKVTTILFHVYDAAWFLEFNIANFPCILVSELWSVRDATNVVERLICVPRVRYDPQVLLTTYLRCLPIELWNQLAGEAMITVHKFPSFSKKALDLEAKIRHGHQPTTDGRKKTLPPNWKAKGHIMFVDNDGSTIELDDDFQEGVGSEPGSAEASGGGAVAASVQKAAEQGGQLQRTSGNHSEANGQAEQLNRAAQHLLRHYIKPNHMDWDEKLALIASLYNNTVHSATGVSPNSLLLTFKPRLRLDFLLPENQPTAAPGTLEFAYRYERLMQQAVEHRQQ